MKWTQRNGIELLATFDIVTSDLQLLDPLYDNYDPSLGVLRWKRWFTMRDLVKDRTRIRHYSHSCVMISLDKGILYLLAFTTQFPDELTTICSL
ncbi:hypothetical protein SAMN05421858_3608 [Haladaptatus litoreus]|uniref:Uncharacterized protein n=1 Tax=Haladaptatus litoreus TaxID=553468 RepID=A0A1N7DGQ9_9EURY|nr:hypothetical protein SAMN05421858_3608 [Haladaptatus litoreus]